MKRCVVVGSLAIGGKAPIRVESMLKTPLSDGDSTFKEMNELVDAGCELVRLPSQMSPSRKTLPNAYLALRSQ